MSRSQHYLDALLSGVPLEELSAFEHRAAFQHVKERLIGTQDIEGELRVLYRVNNFSELALQLLWIANRAEQDPSMLEPTAEEQTLVLSLFRHAVGDTGESPVAEQQLETSMGSPTPAVEAESEAPVMEVPEPAVEPTPEITPEPTIEPEPILSSDFGFEEEAPKEETPAEDPFSALREPEPENDTAPVLDPFGSTRSTETPSETDAGADPFGIASTPEIAGEEPSAFGPTTTGEPTAPTFDFPSTEEPSPGIKQDFPSAPTTEPETGAMADFLSAEPTPSPVAPTGATPQVDEGLPEMQFAKLVERFAEALSSGAEDRDAIKDEMLAVCSAVLADGSKPEDHKKFCQVITDFISYIYENGFVDDIRVMNLLSNVPDPVLAWAKADAASRPGMMDAAYDTLREFKSLFE